MDFTKLAGRSFFMDQHGCAKNQVDGELIIARLENLGMVRIEEPEKADLIVINSCGFIESAKKESLDSLLGASECYPDAKILLAGCLAERYADVFSKDLPEADGIFGNGDISRVDEVVAGLFEGDRPVVKLEQKGVCCGDRHALLNYKGSAFVKITEGCNNRCSFCAIPIIRGELRSRKASEIVSEIQSLVDSGIREINLIGQDLAAYGCGRGDSVLDDGVVEDGTVHVSPSGKSYLRILMEMISSVTGDFWIRLLYIHPDHFNRDILDYMKEDSRFLRYFDIPFQSGSDEIIHAMNRKGSFETYAGLVKDIRSAFPDSCIRTTFLTGFPGENDGHALESQKFLEEIQSDWSGCFPYSREDDTPAYSMKKQVAAKKAQARADALVAIQGEITMERLRARCGRDYMVLVEEIIENHEGTDDGLAIGRAWFQAPEVDGNVVIRYDLDDADAVEAIVPGAVVKVHAITSGEVDIDGEYIGK